MTLETMVPAAITPPIQRERPHQSGKREVSP